MMSPLLISTGSWRLTRVTSGPLATCMLSISGSRRDTCLDFDCNSWVITAASNNVRKKGTNLKLSKFILEVTSLFLCQFSSLMTFQSRYSLLSSHASLSATTEAGPWFWHMAHHTSQDTHYSDLRDAHEYIQKLVCDERSFTRQTSRWFYLIKTIEGGKRLVDYNTICVHSDVAHI